MNEEALLEALTEEIKSIKSTLDEAKLAGQTFNEAQTEFIVIDPLLKRLGYGPLEVSKREHDSVTKKFPDYTLLPGKSQKWFLEAKRLDLNLQDNEAEQAVNYANNQGAEWAVLTNGRRWYIYNAHLPKALPEKRVMQIDDLFADDSAVQKLMLLSKLSILDNALREAWIFQQLSAIIDNQLTTPHSEVRQVIRRLANATIKSTITDETIGKVLLFTSPTAGTTSHPIAAATKGDDRSQAGNTAELADCTETSGEPEINYYTFDEIAKDMTLATFRKPKIILFSDGHSKAVKTWADVARLVVEYIGNSFTLPPLPFSTSNKGKNYFLNSIPTHGSGKAMASYRIVTIHSQEVYIDTNRSTLNICASLLALFKVAHVPLAEIRVSIE